MKKEVIIIGAMLLTSMPMISARAEFDLSVFEFDKSYYVEIDEMNDCGFIQSNSEFYYQIDFDICMNGLVEIGEDGVARLCLQFETMYGEWDESEIEINEIIIKTEAHRYTFDVSEQKMERIENGYKIATLYLSDVERAQVLKEIVSEYDKLQIRFVYSDTEFWDCSRIRPSSEEVSYYEKLYEHYIEAGGFEQEGLERVSESYPCEIKNMPTKAEIYEKAVKYVENEMYEKAAETFYSIAEYEDSLERFKEYYYKCGKEYYEACDYRQAMIVFSTLAQYEYEDSQTKKVDSEYLYAKQLYKNNDFKSAVFYLKKLGDYQDSEELLKECNYHIAQQYFEECDYEKAIEIYESLGNYLDSVELRRESLYRQAEQYESEWDTESAEKIYYQIASEYYEAGMYQKALVEYQAANEYKDSTVKVKECQYQYAMEAFEAGYYVDAIAYFEMVYEFADSADKVKECHYFLGMNAFEEERYEDAIVDFENAGIYSDSRRMIKVCQYQIAKSDYDKKMYQNALEKFEALGDFEESEEMVKACRYQLAMQKYKKNQYDEAIELFVLAKDYQDSSSWIDECNYQKALILYEKNMIDEAREMFVELGVYKDSSDKVLLCDDYYREIDYLEAKRQLSESDFEEAKALFEQLGTYKDSEEMVKECLYQQAVSLVSDMDSFNDKEALALFQLLNDYKDSPEQVEKFGNALLKEERLYMDKIRYKYYHYDDKGRIEHTYGQEYTDEYLYLTYKYDEDGKLLSDGKYDYSYDNNGRIIADDIHTYTYNDASNIISDGIYSYEYGDTGLIMLKKSEKETIVHFYDNGDRLVKTASIYQDGSKAITNYVYGVVYNVPASERQEVLVSEQEPITNRKIDTYAEALTVLYDYVFSNLDIEKENYGLMLYPTKAIENTVFLSTGNMDERSYVYFQCMKKPQSGYSDSYSTIIFFFENGECIVQQQNYSNTEKVKEYGEAHIEIPTFDSNAELELDVFLKDNVESVPSNEFIQIMKDGIEETLEIIEEYLSQPGLGLSLENLESDGTVAVLGENHIYTDAESVQKVQNALNQLGYDCGTPDGIAGSKTQIAIQQYRQDISLSDGMEIDDRLLRSLGI